ncbi:MAG: hypothetical protein U0521_04625 [Anaerolineae bacterium]
MASAQDARTPADICASAVPAPEPATREYAQQEQVLQPGVDYSAIFCTDVARFTSICLRITPRSR